MEIAAVQVLEAVAGPLGEEFEPWRERVIGDGNGAPVGSLVEHSDAIAHRCYSPGPKAPAYGGISADGPELPALFGRFRFAQFAVAFP